MNTLRNMKASFLPLCLLWEIALCCNPSRFYTRFREEDSTLTFVIGGTMLHNQTALVGSSLVELLGVNGSCRGYQITLPYTLCNHRAIFVPLQEKIFVCGGFHNETCKRNRHESSRRCLLWRKGDLAFRELTFAGSQLPELEGFGSDAFMEHGVDRESHGHKIEERRRPQSKFDFQHAMPDAVFYRPWGFKSFHKGFVGGERDELIWRKRHDLPLALRRGCSVIFKNRFVVIGGEYTAANGENIASNLMLRYLDTKDGREIGWQVMGKMLEPLIDIECLTYGNGILVIGGKHRRDYDTFRARQVRYWDEKTGQWDEETKFRPLNEIRTAPAVTVMQTLIGMEKVIVLGGYDDVNSPRFPRFLMDAEMYSPVLHTWAWPEFGLDEPKSDMAVVTIPASWIPECSDPLYFANAITPTLHSALSLSFVLLIICLGIK